MMNEEQKFHPHDFINDIEDDHVFKRGLLKTIKKIDVDKNELLNVEELTHWLEYLHKITVEREFETKWKYIQRYIDDQKLEGLTYEAYENMLNPVSEREKRRKRWELVDEDKNGFLSKDELFNYLHPKYSKKFKDLEVNEAFAEADADGDGRMNLDEFQKYMAKNFAKTDGTGREIKESDLKTYFQLILDMNKDGYLDSKEVRILLIKKGDFDTANSLIESHDKNNDHMLDEKEIMQNPRHFGPILPHEFWDAFVDMHDEL
ncbi:calumenin-B-like protein [Dinothrombium tinctorium]|uniref:Calumenin-B-like protein n=1 Tax=Dinothrombium tinctorium TaxID=1965070 RepID=A0A443RM14_9ACAR|nr:calumenin-B-like protein [Dinothrombium tinctorium]